MRHAQVDHQCDARRPLDWDVGRPFAPQDARDLAGKEAGDFDQ
jgi:hypothetical protein